MFANLLPPLLDYTPHRIICPFLVFSFLYYKIGEKQDINLVPTEKWDVEQAFGLEGLSPKA